MSLDILDLQQYLDISMRGNRVAKQFIDPILKSPKLLDTRAVAMMGVYSEEGNKLMHDILVNASDRGSLKSLLIESKGIQATLQLNPLIGSIINPLSEIALSNPKKFTDIYQSLPDKAKEAFVSNIVEKGGINAIKNIAIQNPQYIGVLYDKLEGKTKLKSEISNSLIDIAVQDPKKYGNHLNNFLKQHAGDEITQEAIKQKMNKLGPLSSYLLKPYDESWTKSFKRMDSKIIDYEKMQFEILLKHADVKTIRNIMQEGKFATYDILLNNAANGHIQDPLTLSDKEVLCLYKMLELKLQQSGLATSAKVNLKAQMRIIEEKYNEKHEITEKTLAPMAKFTTYVEKHSAKFLGNTLYESVKDKDAFINAREDFKKQGALSSEIAGKLPLKTQSKLVDAIDQVGVKLTGTKDKMSIVEASETAIAAIKYIFTLGRKGGAKELTDAISSVNDSVNLGVKQTEEKAKTSSQVKKFMENITKPTSNQGKGI